MATMGSIALNYHTRGWSVFPLLYRSKFPWVDWRTWSERQPDRSQIEAWWQHMPMANIALATGTVSDVFVVDCDTIAAAVAWEDRKDFAHTLRTRTSRGVHYFYRMPDFEVRNRAKILPGVDIRGTGGFVVLPPSIHPSGDRYIAVPNPIQPAPSSLLELLQAKQTMTPSATPKLTSKPPSAGGAYWAGVALEREIDTLAGASDGVRNNALNRAAYNLGQLVGDRLLDRSDVERVLLSTALSIGLGERESLATIKSGMDAGELNPRSLRRVR